MELNEEQRDKLMYIADVLALMEVAGAGAEKNMCPAMGSVAGNLGREILVILSDIDMKQLKKD